MTDMRRTSLLRQILDSSLTELVAWRSRHLPEQDIHTYVEVLVHYLKREANQLENIARYVSFDDHPELFWLASLRVQLCSGKLRVEQVRHFLSVVPKHGIWWPEIEFVAGMAFEACGQSEEAKRMFVSAEASLRGLGAMKKAEKARLHVQAIEAAQAAAVAIASGAAEATRPVLPKERPAALQPKPEPAPAPAAQTSAEKPPLTRMESSLLRCLIERPLSKFEIAQRLFARADYSVAESRVEELLDGILRKHPELVRREKAFFAARERSEERLSS